jgi:hypothetical protein
LAVGDNAKITLAADGTRMVRTDELSVSATGGKVDLKNNSMIIAEDAGTWQDGNYTGIAGLVKAARGAGTWNGNSGITTSMADAVSGITTLAVAAAGDVGIDTFADQSVSPNDTLVMYTFNGDANLSGTLDADDYFAIDSNHHRSGEVFGFAKGDFNYDGAINGDDYALIDAAYFAQAGGFSLAPSAGVSSVPEPSLLGLALVPLFAATRRRRAG